MIGRVLFALVIALLISASACSTNRNIDNSRTEDLRKRAIVMMENIYSMISTSNNSDHNTEIRNLVKKSDFTLTRLDILKPTKSLQEYQQNRRISEADSVQEFCMVRPIFNNESCHECHPSSEKELGLIDVCIDAEKL